MLCNLLSLVAKSSKIFILKVAKKVARFQMPNLVARAPYLVARSVRLVAKLVPEAACLRPN